MAKVTVAKQERFEDSRRIYKMQKFRIGVAIHAQHMHAEDQQLYHGVRAFSEAHPEFHCVLAPFAAEDLKTHSSKSPRYHGVLAQATPQLVDIATTLGVPVVDVWRDSVVRAKINCVFPDFSKAGSMAAEHLMGRGFENFGYVVRRGVQSQLQMCDIRRMPEVNEVAPEQVCGFVPDLESHGFTCTSFVTPRRVASSNQVWQRWVKSIRSWLKKQPKPLGLFAPNDWLCRYIADACSELGYQVPQDVGLVCAENEPNLCLLTYPSLTSIDLGYRQVGYEAASMLHSLLTEKEAATEAEREIKFVEPHVLHPRQSTDASQVRDPEVAAAMKYIRDHASEPIGVADVAAHVMTTRRTLERRFRAVLNRTVMKEITRCRLDQLKRLLIESDEPIKCLVKQSGFRSGRVLYETFVREEGVSPSAYRTQRWVGGKPEPGGESES